ncbi:MAG: carbon storage regulator [Planctomycetota bacterium]
MLVLERTPGGAIHIGGGITVELIRIQGQHAWLGFTAPQETPIFRAEVIEKADRDAAGRLAQLRHERAAAESGQPPAERRRQLERKAAALVATIVQLCMKAGTTNETDAAVFAQLKDFWAAAGLDDDAISQHLTAADNN